MWIFWTPNFENKINIKQHFPAPWWVRKNKSWNDSNKLLAQDWKSFWTCAPFADISYSTLEYFKCYFAYELHLQVQAIPRMLVNCRWSCNPATITARNSCGEWQMRWNVPKSLCFSVKLWCWHANGVFARTSNGLKLYAPWYLADL